MQRLRLSEVQALMDTEIAWGYMQFSDESVPAQVWNASAMDSGGEKRFVDG